MCDDVELTVLHYDADYYLDDGMVDDIHLDVIESLDEVEVEVPT